MTRLDSDITRPSNTEVGDGPADTTDPTEEASTRLPQPGDEARARGTVNAVVRVVRPVPEPHDKSQDRYEEYDVLDPDGKSLHMRRNLETGATQVVQPRSEARP